MDITEKQAAGKIDGAAGGARPWHLWLVGILGLVWNAGGAFDYTMTQTRNEAYLARFTEEQLAYFFGFPAWADAAWALGVWSAVAGSVLLLARSRWAAWAFAVSLAGLALTALYQFTADMPESLSGPGMWAFAAAIWAITIFLLWYAAAMRRRGVLR